MPQFRGQANKAAVYAVDQSTGKGKTGDAANITAQISKDYGASAATTDVNPAELDATNHPGVYVFDLTAAESEAWIAQLTASSATTGVLIDPVEVHLQDPPNKLGAVVADAGNTASTFKTDLTAATNDYYKGAFVRFYTGGLVDQVQEISAYNGTTKFVTTVGAFTAAPAAADRFEIVSK